MLVTTDVNAPTLDMAEILRNSGVKSLRSLTSAEMICAEEIPGIGWHLFCETFGGSLRSEWPNCQKKPGYESFLCAYAALQPFMPRDPGEPGLVLQLPVVDGSQNDKSTFHVLTTMSQDDGTLYYRGKYAKIPLPQLQFKWENLPQRVRIADICYKRHLYVISLVPGKLDQTGTVMCHACTPCSHWAQRYVEARADSCRGQEIHAAQFWR